MRPDTPERIRGRDTKPSLPKCVFCKPSDGGGGGAARMGVGLGEREGEERAGERGWGGLYVLSG